MTERPRIRWPALLQESAAPLFVLNHARRLRFVNEAWERLTGVAATDALGNACTSTGPTEALYRTLAPPRGSTTRTAATVRRTAPKNKLGPPWWDVTFIRLATAEGGRGWIGIIDVVAAGAGTPPKSAAPFVAALREQTAERFTLDLFGGTSLESRQFAGRLRQAAAGCMPLWFHGEPGTGRLTAARIVHHHGPHRERPFARIDCRALQPYLVEATLFGNGGLAAPDRLGTIVFEEPAALPRDLQQTILAWLLSDRGTPRLIGLSRRLPAVDIEEGTLLPEFAVELAPLELSPPPLRRRREELSAIVQRLLQPPREIADDALALLAGHDWPGNLNELRTVLALAKPGPVLAAADLPRYLRERALVDAASDRPRPSLDAILETVEKKLIERALAESGGNQTDAASRLGIFRTRLARRIDALGLGGPKP